jgi:N6-adenosine-specific RNA methylase IME4
MKFHQLANLFPMMEPTEFKALVEDIKQNGQLHPIVIWEDQILDGRNRWRACEKLNIEPKYTTFDGSDPFSFVVSLNLHRRHLSSSQRAAIALSFEEHFAKEAARIQRTGKKINLTQKVEYGRNERTAASQAAKLLRTNRTYVSTAKKIREISPVLFQEVLAGKQSLHQAIKKARQLHPKNTPALEGTFEVLYIDPPWTYTGPASLAVLAQNRYGTMTQKELIQLGDKIKDITADDAAIFLWTTNIKLPEALQLLELWGFSHKGQIIWNKINSNALEGHWLRLKHEILLLGSKGQLTPKSKPPSVISTERTRHSKKPGVFAEWIEKMFPEQSKIELFARSSRAGWTVWGDEISSHDNLRKLEKK